MLSEWQVALKDAREDPTRLSDRADWAAKLALLRTYAEDLRRWDQDTMRAVEMEYHDVDPETSLFDVLVGMGRIRTLVDENRIQTAMTTPPNSRAKHRAKIVSEQADRIEAIGWRRVVVAGEIIEFEIETEPNEPKEAS